MQKRSLLFAAALLFTACAGQTDDGASADDIALSVPRAKLSGVKPVQAKGDASLKLSARPRFEQPTTVVLELEGDPVAVVRSRTGSRRPLAAMERAQIESSLMAQQERMVPSIEAMGGEVLARFQNAINGIKVRGTPEQIAAMSQLPGVVAVRRVALHERLNAISVPFIGAPAVWDGGRSGFRGEGVKVAIIDTGIDFTHANFGGPGTPDAYNAAFAADTQPADPALFGPTAPKVKGGIDLVGDDYDPSNPQATPKPDMNPLDCGAHGSHVAGTVAGFGVNADGTTYKGSYDANTPNNQWLIGPGVAPLADLYAVRVFGCSGSTNVVVDAIDWAVKNDMDVINMSLGSPFGSAGDADAVAASNAAEAGLVVVAAAGNEGGGNYITGSPAGGDKVISVAAMDSNSPQSFPGVTLNIGTQSALVQNSNNAAFNGTPLQVYVLPDGKGGVSLGCDEAEYVDAQIAGKLVVTQRGTCARVFRAQMGQKHGAAAVALINNGPGYPYFEGDIPVADGATTFVTIPFLGVLQSDAAKLTGAASASFGAATPIANPAWHAFADFSSGGPRTGDGFLKPDISGPGVNVVSTAMGTGNQGVAFSGTSMATPHVAGVAALVLESHPFWPADDVRKAILNTADAYPIQGFRVRLGGSGLVKPFPATRTAAIAYEKSSGRANLSFGVAEFTSDYRKTKTVKIQNNGAQGISFSISNVVQTGSPATVSVWPQDLYVPAGSSRTFDVTLIVPASKVGDSSDFREVAGLVVATPASGQNGGSGLTIPYYLVPRARSLVRTGTLSGSFGPKKPKANLKIYNDSKFVGGTVDLYSWGLAGKNQDAADVGIRAVGVQANPYNGDQLLFFAVNTFKPWSNNAANEFDLLIDTTGAGKPNFAVVAADEGYLTTGSPDGTMVTALINLTTGAGQVQFPVVTPTDGSTLLIPVFAGDLGVTAANPRFSYSVNSFSGTGATDTTGWAKFNAWTNSVTTASFVTLQPGQHSTLPLAINATEWAQTPSLGVMIVGMENYNDIQAKLLSIGTPAAQ